jgi:hypothetical protein
LPDSILIIENDSLQIHNKKNTLKIMLSDISSVNVCRTNKKNETYITFYINVGNDIVADFIVDKFYFVPAKFRARKIVFELHKHLENEIIQSGL